MIEIALQAVRMNGSSLDLNDDGVARAATPGALLIAKQVGR